MSTKSAVGKKKTKNPKAVASSLGMQLLLLLDVYVRLTIWAAAMSITLMVMARTHAVRTLSWDSLRSFGGAWDFAQRLTQFILVFNLAYLLVLIAIGCIVPRPRRGFYKLKRIPNLTLLYAGLRGNLTKARYHAPFPAFLVQQFGNIQPFRWLLGLGIGPRTKTSFFLDPALLDPWAMTIGRNVNIGFGTTISAHVQEFDYVIVDPVVIEDNVMIGAHSAIACGVHIKRGAYVEPFAVVKPGEVIGEGELWAGRPAKKKGYYRFTAPVGDGERRAEQEGETPTPTG